MATPGEWNLEIVKDDSYRFDMRYVNEDETGVDITGLDITWTLTFNDTDFVFTIGDGVVVDDPTEGEISLVLTSEQTSEFLVRVGGHRLRLFDVSDQPTTLLWGTVVVNKAPSNAC